MTEVFISYSKQDRLVATALATKLKTWAIEVWWDYDLYAGENFHDTILASIDAAKAVIVVWSDTAARSSWVRDEATRASRQIKLVATHLPTFNLENLPLGFGQIHSTSVDDDAGILRALQRFGLPRQVLRSHASVRPLADQRILGMDPKSGKRVALCAGRFGPYVQLGDVADEEKPKQVLLPRGRDPGMLDLKGALQLLSLPREIGIHPGTGKMIIANIGRYGSFVHHDGRYANLASDHEVFLIDLKRAVDLLAKRGSRGTPFERVVPTVLRELGEHPLRGGPVLLLDGRYGLYVKHGDVNATVPRILEPNLITLDQAISLLIEREEKRRPLKTRQVN